MPFGLKGAPSTFQRLMTQEVLAGYLHQFAIVYLDDIIIYSEDYETHQKHLRLVLERLQLHGLRCAPSKCHLGKTEIEYLGHVVGHEGNRPQQRHLDQIKNATPPVNRKGLRSFLGVCNWLKDYVPNFASIAYLLTDQLSTKGKFTWSTKQQGAFDNLKEALSQALPLNRPDPNYPFILQTDASRVGMAAVLYQEIDQQRRVIAYASARFAKREQNYHINEQECLAIVWGIRRYRPYLEDRRFLLRTDNKALTWLKQMKDVKAKLTRWSIELQGYTFDIEHCPGHQNELPDLLSRDPSDETYHEDDVQACPAGVTTLADEVRQAQRNDEVSQRFLRELQELDRNPPNDPGWQRGFHRNYHRNADGFLTFGERRKLFVPHTCRTRVLFEHHDAAPAGHPGAEETLRTIAENYHWPVVEKDVQHYVRECLLCAQYKRRTGPAATQRPRQPQRPFEIIACDIMGPYPVSQSNNRFIVVFTDLFSRWVEAFPVSSATTTVILRLMEREIFPRFGYPKAIISDNGPQFLSRMWENHLQHWRILGWTTGTYMPRENPTERRNQELKKTLRLHLDGRAEDSWDQQIERVLFNVRRRRNAATGFSPSKLLYGQDLPFPGAWDAPANNQPPVAVEERQEEARQHQHRYVEQRRQAEGPPPPVYQPGDLVLMRHRYERGRPFVPKWSGPFRVNRRIGNTQLYFIIAEGRRVKCHVDRIRPAPPRRDLGDQA